MGTTVNPNQIGTIGNILGSKGDNALEKLYQELKASEVAASPVITANPEQIKATQHAQAAYGQAAVAMNSKEKYLKEAQERLAKRKINPDTTLRDTIDKNLVRGESVRISAKRSAKTFIKADKRAAKLAQKSKPYAEAAVQSAKDTVTGAAKTTSKSAADIAKEAERVHFNKLYSEVKGRNAAAQKALQERFKAYKGQNGILRRISKFFNLGAGKKVWGPIKRQPKLAAAVLAATVIIGYAMIGNKASTENQINTENI